MKKIALFLCLALSCVVGKKLVVLDPAAVEILYAIGGEKNIVAIATMQGSSIYPEEKTSQLNSVGTFSHPSLEKIIALKPDVVILSSYSLNLKENLQRFGIKAVLLKADTLNEIAQNITTLGELTSQKVNAKKVRDDYEKKIKTLKEHPIDKKGVFVYSSHPLMVFTKGTLPDDIFNTIGIKNIAQNVIGSRPILSQEFILQENPEVILYGLRINDKNELLKANPLLSRVKAFQNEEVFYIDFHTLLRGTPRIVDEIIKLKNTIVHHTRFVFQEATKDFYLRATF